MKNVDYQLSIIDYLLTLSHIIYKTISYDIKKISRDDWSHHPVNYGFCPTPYAPL